MLAIACPGTLSNSISARKFIQEFDSLWLSRAVIRLAVQLMSRENPAKLIDDKSKMPNDLFILLRILIGQIKNDEKYKNPNVYSHHSLCFGYVWLPE
jgi:hypothetical protein